jgi:hypothetical protein
LAETNTNRDIRTFYYKQVLDHFNYLPQSYRTFQQRYFINFKYWGGANSTAPIFVSFGGEAAIDSDPGIIGFMTENAEKFKALLVYIEVGIHYIIIIFKIFSYLIQIFYCVNHHYCVIEIWYHSNFKCYVF